METNDFKRIINSVSFDKVINKIAELFPQERDSLVAYEWLIAKLRNLEPSMKHKDMVIVVYPAIDVFDKNEKPKHNYVCGYSLTECQTYGIELCLHAEWLGMQVSEGALKHYGKEGYLAHVLCSMTFFGFKDAQIQDFLDEIEEPIEELGSDEIKSYSMEEFFKSLPQKTEEEIRKEKIKIDRINQKNKEALCEILGIDDPETVSYFTGTAYLKYNIKPIYDMYMGFFV